MPRKLPWYLVEKRLKCFKPDLLLVVATRILTVKPALLEGWTFIIARIVALLLDGFQLCCGLRGFHHSISGHKTALLSGV